jgi:hypothetical protein
MEGESTFISCLAWIHKGYAAKVPKEIELTEEEINEMKNDPMVAEGYPISQLASANNKDKQ